MKRIASSGGRLAAPFVTIASSRFTDSSSGASANVARAVVVIIGEHAADFSVLSDARRPVILVSLSSWSRSARESASCSLRRPTNSSMSFWIERLAALLQPAAVFAAGRQSFSADLRRPDSAVRWASGLLRSVSMPPL